MPKRDKKQTTGVVSNGGFAEYEAPDYMAKSLIEDEAADQAELMLYKKIASRQKAAMAIKEANGYNDIKDAYKELPEESEFDKKVREQLKRLQQLQIYAESDDADNEVSSHTARVTLENMRIGFKTRSLYNIARNLAKAEFAERNRTFIKNLVSGADAADFVNSF